MILNIEYLHSKPGENLAALHAHQDTILACITSECLKLNIVKLWLLLFGFPSLLCELSSSVYGPFLFWGHLLTNRQKSGSGKRNDSSKELCHPFLVSRGGRDTSQNKKRDRESKQMRQGTRHNGVQTGTLGKAVFQNGSVHWPIQDL